MFPGFWVLWLVPGLDLIRRVDTYCLVQKVSNKHMAGPIWDRRSVKTHDQMAKAARTEWPVIKLKYGYALKSHQIKYAINAAFTGFFCFFSVATRKFTITYIASMCRVHYIYGKALAQTLRNWEGEPKFKPQRTELEVVNHPQWVFCLHSVITSGNHSQSRPLPLPWRPQIISIFLVLPFRVHGKFLRQETRDWRRV